MDDSLNNEWEQLIYDCVTLPQILIDAQARKVFNAFRHLIVCCKFLYMCDFIEIIFTS